MLLREIINFLDNLYPINTSLSWDNSGLQVGNLQDKIHSILISLSITGDTINYAKQNGCNLIIAHHPLIFESIKCLDLEVPLNRNIAELLINKISVYSMHTNLDVARNGVSEALASKYGYTANNIIRVTANTHLYKLIIYVPADTFDEFRMKFLDCAVGHIGNYARCSFSTSGEGTYMPLENATPYLGTKGDLSRVKEYKLETIVREQDLAEVVKQMKALHVYEEVAYDVIKLENAGDEVGLGRWTEIEATTMDLLRQKFTDATFSGDLTTNKIVTKIGFCGGSGGTLVKDAQSLGLQVLVSSEFGYHEELYAKDYGITLIDLGHKASEEPVLDVLAKLLETKIKDLKILVC